MDTETVYPAVFIVFAALGIIAAPVLCWIPAPYGRFTPNKGWGPAIRSDVAWVLMEAPAPVTFLLSTFTPAPPRTPSPACILLAAAYLAHYLHRAFLFPLSIHSSRRSQTIPTTALAALFNTTNAYLLSRALFHLPAHSVFSPNLPPSWPTSPAFAAGVAIFALGAAMNVHADYTLLRLRRRRRVGDAEVYRVPQGWMFRVWAAPNYVGEMVEWAGWALAARGMPAAVGFAAWTVANLAPRAVATERWYRGMFEEYRVARRWVLVPGLC